MQLKMYSFYDSKAQCYGTPFFMINAATACRVAIDLAQDQQSTISRHPADYWLHELATWDDQLGQIVGHVSPVNLGMVQAMLPPPVPELPLMQPHPLRWGAPGDRPNGQAEG